MRPLLIQAALASSAALALTHPACAQSAGVKTVYDFTGAFDGAYPMGALTADRDGNLYGTTNAGGYTSGSCGSLGCGTIYKLDRQGNLTTIYAFIGYLGGQSPTTGVARIGRRLYGASFAPYPLQKSILFSLNTDGSGFKQLYSLNSTVDGYFVAGQLQQAADYGVFGVCRDGGLYGGGTLFYLTPSGTFANLHNFGGSGDGQSPTSLIEDAHGNLFGATAYGGSGGLIFEYAPSTRSYQIIYIFASRTDGSNPLLGAVGPDGTLYGATAYGGSQNKGTLFALTPSNGTYTFSVLSPIKSKIPQDGPIAPPTLTASGALVGPTLHGEIYQYANGVYTARYTNSVVATSQLFAIPGRQGELIATSTHGGTGLACNGGCGFISKIHQ